MGSFKKSVIQHFGPPKVGNFPCQGCWCCSNIGQGDTFTHPHAGGKKCHIRQRYTCSSKFVIYITSCPCGLAYIGETTMEIRKRISKHKSTIRTGLNKLPILKHFAEKAHTISQLKFCVINSIPVLRWGGDRQLLLQERELMWIHRLDCLAQGAFIWSLSYTLWFDRRWVVFNGLVNGYTLLYLPPFFLFFVAEIDKLNKLNMKGLVSHDGKYWTTCFGIYVMPTTVSWSDLFK